MTQEVFFSASVVWLGVSSVAGVFMFTLGRRVGGGRLASIVVIEGGGGGEGMVSSAGFCVVCVHVDASRGGMYAL